MQFVLQIICLHKVCHNVGGPRISYVTSMVCGKFPACNWGNPRAALTRGQYSLGGMCAHKEDDESHTESAQPTDSHWFIKDPGGLLRIKC